MNNETLKDLEKDIKIWVDGNPSDDYEMLLDMGDKFFKKNPDLYNDILSNGVGNGLMNWFSKNKRKDDVIASFFDVISYNTFDGDEYEDGLVDEVYETPWGEYYYYAPEGLVMSHKEYSNTSGERNEEHIIV